MLSIYRFVSAMLVFLLVAASAAAIRAIAEEPTDLTTPQARYTSRFETGSTGDDSPPVVSETTEANASTPSQPSTFGGTLCERTKLTGDCFCLRPALASHGITLDVSNTQFYQGLTCGGLEQSFSYGGRNDYSLNMDGEKLGLWKGSFVTLHGETRYGESVNFLTGALMPANIMLMVPQPDGAVSALSGVKFTQFLSENSLVFAGKINTFDDFRQPLTSAGTLNGFQNTALMFNPVYARTIPYSTFGAGFAQLHHHEPVLSAAVFDTNNTPTVSGFDTFFDNGATIFLQANLPTNFFCLPGHQGVSGTYSSGIYTILSRSAYFDPFEGFDIAPTPKTGSWCLTYNFDQALYVSPDDPRRKWGLFGNLGIADDNPSPIRWFASAGISGASPIIGRNADSFGIGYFYLGVSNRLKDLAPVILPLKDEHGMEAYYNAAITPWCQVTPNLQVISPYRDVADTSLLFGLRAKIEF
jgi:porin